MMFFFIFIFCVAYLAAKSYSSYTNIWNRISDDIWISKDRRFKIYYSTSYWMWVVSDDKRGDMQTLETLEVCMTWVKNILNREKADKSGK